MTVYTITNGGIPVYDVVADSPYHAVDKFINLFAQRGVEVERAFIRARKRK